MRPTLADSKSLKLVLDWLKREEFSVTFSAHDDGSLFSTLPFF